MRNMKKFLALVLAMMMVFSMAVVTTSAAEEADYSDAALNLNALKVMQGDLSGDLMLDADVTRYQTALFFVRALTGKTDTAIWNAEKTSANFADVQEYGTAIDYAYGVGVVRGRGNGVFGFNDKILYKDMIVMAVRALGYETEDMQYPYGHILAAQKLDLLDDIDNVNYEAALNRGETAQLIWNMLQAKVAVVDPLTDKVIYPGDTSLTGSLSADFAAELENRKTLLEESGLAGGKFVDTITAFTPADEDDEESVDTVTVGDYELAAADFGITAETPAATYLGLDVEVFYNTDSEDGFAQDDYDEGDATIVLVKYPEYTVVENLAGDTKIKVTETKDEGVYAITLDGTKFTPDKYYFAIKTFGEDGWVVDDSVFNNAMASFFYTSKDGYLGADQDTPFIAYADELNTYVQVAYRVTDTITNFGTEDAPVNKTYVEVLYTPYTFGQYVERELVSAATGSEEKFVILGTLGNDLTTDIEGNDTYVTETLVDGNAVAKKISKTKGEAALSVKVEGVEVESGDFMFYNYNAVDNILTVAANCGAIETGRLTAYSNTKETVKVSGTNYEFGFAGLYDALVEYTDITPENYVDALEAGKDNVQFLAIDGKIVWMAEYTGEADAASYGFAIVSFDDELMADLLGLTLTKYENKLTGGYYLEDGYVVAAVLDVTTGKWELGKIEAVAADWYIDDQGDDDASNDVLVPTTGYNAEEEEYDSFVDIATLVKYAEIATLADEKAIDLAVAELVLATGPIYAVVESEDDVYTLAAADLVDCYQPVGGTLTFNANGRTNAIKATADEDVDAARVTTGDASVIVVIGQTQIAGADTDTTDDDVYAPVVEVRTGAQTSKKNLDELGVDDATFYAADASLIVLTTAADVTGWGQGTSVASEATYYVVMPGYGVEYETEAEEDYTLTIEGLFDLKTMEAADDIVITADNIDDLKATAADLAVGAVFFMDEDGELALSEATYAEAVAALLADDDYVEASVTEWADEESITAAGGDWSVSVNDALAAINVKVLTLDLTEEAGFDWADHDLGNLYIDVEYNAADDTYGDALNTTFGENDYFGAELDLDDVVAEITEPTYGIFSNFEIAVAGNETIYAADTVDGEDVNTATIDLALSYVAQYDEDAETLNLIVIKTVVAAEYVAE